MKVKNIVGIMVLVAGAIGSLFFGLLLFEVYNEAFDFSAKILVYFLLSFILIIMGSMLLQSRQRKEAIAHVVHFLAWVFIIAGALYMASRFLIIFGPYGGYAKIQSKAWPCCTYLALTFLIGLAELTGGIGALFHAPWSRRLLIASALSYLLTVIFYRNSEMSQIISFAVLIRTPLFLFCVCSIIILSAPAVKKLFVKK